MFVLANDNLKNINNTFNLNLTTLKFVNKTFRDDFVLWFFDITFQNTVYSMMTNYTFYNIHYIFLTIVVIITVTIYEIYYFVF